MEWNITLITAAASLLLTVVGAWRSGRPRKDSLKAQWVSWRLVTIFAGAILALAVVHAVNLMGFQTGQNARGLMRP